MNVYTWLLRQNEASVKEIEKAINGEYSAIICYSKLANVAPTEEERNQILEIRQDEMIHLQQFAQIYVNLTGQQPKPKLIEECETEYVKGLEAALKDEQMTVDFYLKIGDETTYPSIKQIFHRAAKDEQNHAVWFLYYLMKNR
ncbi:MAG TPA: ferritin-like domain-containing protein [Massilibacterium sp.]|nr:ferritin-like domain-containing protein [Massilibacterium sp.]